MLHKRRYKYLIQSLLIHSALNLMNDMESSGMLLEKSVAWYSCLRWWQGGRAGQKPVSYFGGFTIQNTFPYSYKHYTILTYKFLSSCGVMSTLVLKTYFLWPNKVMFYLWSFKQVNSCEPYKTSVVVWENVNMPLKCSGKAKKFSLFGLLSLC